MAGSSFSLSGRRSEVLLVSVAVGFVGGDATSFSREGAPRKRRTRDAILRAQARAQVGTLVYGESSTNVQLRSEDLDHGMIRMHNRFYHSHIEVRHRPPEWRIADWGQRHGSDMADW